MSQMRNQLCEAFGNQSNALCFLRPVVASSVVAFAARMPCGAATVADARCCSFILDLVNKKIQRFQIMKKRILF
jgi:hypothetical protein